MMVILEKPVAFVVKIAKISKGRGCAAGPEEEKRMGEVRREGGLWWRKLLL
jgi:hypothetical protein